ncbi:nuclear fragile X mental retardation-interacting protein 2-like [Vombatus ursinus]|uniref:nuclear fragile X mental retardation-interacting protein 2-like n=1 Tax=Vombatus ursinus TaxID=29139 RepID=UPI000FFD3C78|nr:nuclear fragile X mental retardation-interacting protein 2-like [Vombatus ursinus]
MDDGENKKQASSQHPKSIDCKLNGELQKAEPDFKMNPNIKASILAETEIRTKNLSENKYKDKKQKPLADKPPTEQATAVISNGVKPKPSDSFTNEHKDREPDKDSSGSEEGYIIPKKQKAKYNMTRSEENFNLMGFKMVTPAPRVPNLQQSFENPKLYSNGQSDIKVVGPKSVWNSERWAVRAGRGKPGPGHMQEKAFDTKPDLNNSKVDPGPKIVPTAPVVPKEEAWSLFNHPTIFSINNSNVPKVTYASKVKQNLYRVQSPPICLESCSESELSPDPIAALSLSSAITGSPSHWLTQSPMSALKPANSLDFANGPEKSMKADSNQVLPLEARLIRRPSSSTKSVIHKVNPNCPPVEPSLFTWSSNVPAALTGLTPNIMPPQTQTQMLKKIFQNEWGLSFITEPSISPEIAQGIAPDPEVIQSPPPHEYPNSLASQETSESPCFAPQDLQHLERPNPDGSDVRLQEVTSSTSERPRGIQLCQEPSHFSCQEQEGKVHSQRPLDAYKFLKDKDKVFFKLGLALGAQHRVLYTAGG